MNPSLIIFLVFAYIALAAFSGEPPTCWHRDCVVRNEAGTICLEADYNGIALIKCADPFLLTLIKKHYTSKADQSISYYDDQGGLLGAATWRIPSPLTFPVFVCMAGQRVDDARLDRIICRRATQDDDMEDRAAHVRECVIERPSTHRAGSCLRSVYAVSPPKAKMQFYEQPVAAAVFWLLSGLTAVGVVLKWGGTVVRGVRVRWYGRCGREREPAPNDNQAQALAGPVRMPVPQPNLPSNS